MKIKPIATLFSGSASSYLPSNEPSIEATASQAATRYAQSDAASVHLASKQKDNNVSADRASLVASIKKRVESGNYKADTTRVAEALYRDLF